MRYETRRRLHLDLADLPVLPTATPTATGPLPRITPLKDTVAHRRELRHARRTLRQQLHDLERIDPLALAEWQLEA